MLMKYVWSHCCMFTFLPATMFCFQEVFVSRVPYFTWKTVKVIKITCDFLMQNWPQPILRLFKPSLLVFFTVVLAFSILLCSNYSILIKPSNTTKYVSLLSLLLSRTTCFGPLSTRLA